MCSGIRFLELGAVMLAWEREMQMSRESKGEGRLACVEAAEVKCGLGMECRLGCGCSLEAKPEGGSREWLWAREREREAVSGLPRLLVKSLEEGGEPASVGRGPSSSILPTELAECQGKLQELHRLLQSLESLHRIPSAPVIPTHQVRSRRRQGPAPGSLPSCPIHLHHLPRQVPCPP